MLGIAIKRTNKTIQLNQTETINELLRKYKIDNNNDKFKLTSTPNYPHNKLSNKLSPQSDEEKIYMNGPYDDAYYNKNKINKNYKINKNQDNNNEDNKPDQKNTDH
jgi:hypothetical protein